MGFAGAGMVLLGAVLVEGGQPVRRLVTTLVFAAFFGVGMWLLTRGTSSRMRENAPIVKGPGLRTERVAFGFGLAGAAFLAVVEVLLFSLVLLFGWESDEEALGIFSGLLLGFAFYLGLNLRDLRRWEGTNDLVIFSRRGAKRLAWTNRQAQTRAVAVSMSDRG